MDTRNLIESALMDMPHGVTIHDMRGKLIYANRKAAEIYAFASTDEMLHVSSYDKSKVDILDVYGNKIHEQDFPDVRVLTTHRPQKTIIRFIYPATQTENWIWVDAGFIYATDGSKKGVISLYYQVVDALQTRQTLMLLNEISDELLATLDHKERIEKFTSLMVPTMADMCIVTLVNEREELIPIAFSYSNVEKSDLVAELRDKYPAQKHASRGLQDVGIWAVLESGRAQIYPSISPEEISKRAIDPRHEQLLQSLKICSMILVPLIINDKTVGVITFCNSESGRHFTKEDMNIFEVVSQRVALLLDHSRIMNNANDTINKQKQSLRDLTDRSNTLRLALDVGNMGVWDYDIRRDIISWSDGFNPMNDAFGGNNEGRVEDFLNHIVAADRDRVRAGLEAAISGRETFVDEFRVVTRDNKRRWMYKKGEVLRDGRGQAIRMIGIGADITSRRRSEEKRRLSESKFKSVFEGSLDSIFICNDDMNIVDVNTAGCEFYGLSRKQLIGRSMSSLVAPYHRREFVRSWEKLQKSTRMRGVYDVIRSKKDTTRIIEYNARAHFLPKKTLFVLRDITQQVEEEKRRQHLLGIASHELRTPLASIKVYADIVRRTFKDGVNKNATEYLQKIDEKADSLTHLINDLLDLARLDEGRLEFSWEMFDPNEFVQQLLAEIQMTTKTHTIKLTGSVPTDIVSDKSRLSQIIINLVRNAIKYSPGSNKVDVKIDSIRGMFQLSVSDSGQGIAKKDIPKIFDLFYRVSSPTKSRVEGLGLGLYISRQIVRNMGGSISVTSTLNHGSTFIVELPMAPKVKS